MRVAFTAMAINLLAVFVAAAGTQDFTPFYASDFCDRTITSKCNTTFSYIDDLNEQIFPLIEAVVRTAYFRYFKINFDKQCKFWNDEHFCSTENCAVEILPQSEIAWNEDSLLSDKRPSAGPHGQHTENSLCDDLDYCDLDDDEHTDIIDLVDNPERFTGYGGKQAHNVWGSIYNENCFPVDAEDSCTGQQLFYRLLSGMHSSISTHLSNEYIPPGGTEVAPSLKLFMERVGEFNDRLANIYFNYGLLSQAIAKLFASYPVLDFIKSSDVMANGDNYDQLFGEILGAIDQNTIFDPKVFNIDEDLKNDFRHKFRNISSIMDCVGCDRCRMWGKLQTIGYGTALKVLFESNSTNSLAFRKIEVVALINTFDRLSKSVHAVNNFKKMYLEHLQDVEKGLVKPGEFDKLTDEFQFPFMQNSNIYKSRINDKLKSEAESVASAKEAASKPQQNQQVSTSNKETASTEGSSGTGLKAEFDRSLNEVYDALKFVMNAYAAFPSTVFKMALIKINEYWNRFIGLEKVYYEDAGYSNLFD